jgi:hypothetical protein
MALRRQRSRHVTLRQRGLTSRRGRSRLVSLAIVVSILVPTPGIRPLSANALSLDCPNGAIDWTGAGSDGLWSNPDNWAGGIVPTAEDDACIPEDATVTVSSAAQVRSLVASGSLTVSASLDLGGPSGVGGTLIINQSSATVSVAESLTLTGPFLWSNGGFGGPGTVVLEGDYHR